MSQTDPNAIIPCRQADLNALRAEAKQAGAREALAGVASTQATGYYSTVRFQAVRVTTAPGVFTYTVKQGKRTAFGYKIDSGLSGDGAGFDSLPATVTSTLNQTNLTAPNQTRDGERYFIAGIAHYLSDVSDGWLAKQIWAKAYCELKMGSNLTFPLGRLSFFPCLGGLSGRALSRLVPPPLGASVQDVWSFANGVEDSDSYFHFPEESPMIWNPAGKTDSQLALTYTLPDDIVFVVDSRPAAAGVVAYDPPDTNEDYSFVDLTVRLVGRSLNQVSLNQ